MDNVAIAREMLAAWNRDGIERMADFWAEDGEWEWQDPPEFPDRRVLRGRDEIEGHLRELMGVIGDLEVEVDELVPIGDELVAVISFTVEGAKSGIELDAPIVQVFRFEDGRVRRCRVFTNREQAIQAARGAMRETGG
ncbi:MAG TPA: nuclear transport factor 2 family protein [Solirubrobacterales bacterium]|nr:nuclear transport factor 2 family protein [Solirubrobacterales bacterium]